MVKKKTVAGKLKVGALQVEKETVQDLSDHDLSQVKGGGDPSLAGGCNTRGCGQTSPAVCGQPTQAGRTCGKKCNP